MILYNKDFLLGKGITFSSYLKALEKKRFPKYYLRIEKIPSTTDYRATITFTVPTWQWSLRGAFIDGVLLRECRIRYLEGEKHFTIQASARTPNLILASFMVIGAIFLFILELFMITTNKSASFNNISILTTVMILMLIPSTWIYLQDKNFLDRVGSLGTELEKS